MHSVVKARSLDIAEQSSAESWWEVSTAMDETMLNWSAFS